LRQAIAKPEVAIVGLGYVGLSTAACLASRGFKVHGIDIDKKKLELIESGSQPIHEFGLEPLLRGAIRKKALTLESGFEGISESAIVLITVGTPSREDGSIDAGYVDAAAEAIGRQLRTTKGYRLVVVKSTVVPGTTENLVIRILEKNSGKKAGADFGLASNPEFLHEGNAIAETFHPDALLIGGIDHKSTATLLKMYRLFHGRLPPKILTSPSNAEMMKYAINAGRASQLSFVNTIANLCSRVPGCDYDEVKKGLSLVAKMDPRYLNAGLGFGGSCLPKDARALASFSRSVGVSDEILRIALRVNDAQVGEAIRLAEGLGGELGSKRVSILGLAFKAGTDDIRESVSISLAQTLVKRGARVSVYDPVAIQNAKRILEGSVEYATSAKECLKGSDCAIIATAWDEFKKLRPADFRTLMAFPLVIDGRRIYDQNRFLSAGLSFATVGTGPGINRT
jgi:UDPglucose 6-dehydrogenase